jgi:hypothetical protein
MADPIKLTIPEQLSKVVSSIAGAKQPIDAYAIGKATAVEADIKIEKSTSPKINIVTEIADKYKGASPYSWETRLRDKSLINEITIHGTAGASNAKTLISWMIGPKNGVAERNAEYVKSIALFHYLLDRDGTIYQIIDPLYWVYHSSSSINDKFTIGIECIKPDPTNMCDLTELQYQGLFSLIFDYLMVEFPISRIASHNYRARKYKGYGWNCPKTFDWKRLSMELTQHNYGFKEYGFPEDKGLKDLRYDIVKLS